MRPLNEKKGIARAPTGRFTHFINIHKSTFNFRYKIITKKYKELKDTTKKESTD